MSNTYVARLTVHVVALVAAAAAWLLLADFATAMLASIVVFVAISLFGQRRFGHLPGPDDMRRQVERMLHERDRQP